MTRRAALPLLVLATSAAAQRPVVATDAGRGAGATAKGIAGRDATAGD